MTTALRVFTNPATSKIDLLKVLREFTGQSLPDAKTTMDKALPFVLDLKFDGQKASLEEFAEAVNAAGATVVIGSPVFEMPNSVAVLAAESAMLKEIKAVRSELGSLRAHLGMIRHE
jgi:hypothetical protein